MSTVEHPRINEWLSEMEKQMRLTLAKNLAKAVQVIKNLKSKQKLMFTQKVLKFRTLSLSVMALLNVTSSLNGVTDIKCKLLYCQPKSVGLRMLSWRSHRLTF